MALVALTLPTRARADQPARPPLEGPPVAESADEQAARAHYELGLTHYHLGQFDDAANEFKKAYELSKKPKLMFNIAQALRLGGHHSEAVYFYRTYLRLVPDAPNRSDVEEFIGESENAARAEAERVRAAEAEARRERERAARADDEARRERSLRRTGLITMGSGVVVAGVGAFFAVRAASAASDLTALADGGGMWSDEMARKQRDGERDDVIGTSLIIAGTAVALTGVVVYTWNTWHVGESPPRVAALPARGGASLWLGWSF